ncbi:hypothetical protein BDF19DRAFT_452156 [Syncephalis fuscata]|nr:hypothetical protein BDF19DRAFT_452156 [Syncephalis fuscata]
MIKLHKLYINDILISLAWMELRVTLVELVRRFTFVASPKNDMAPLYRDPVSPRGRKFVVEPSRA